MTAKTPPLTRLDDIAARAAAADEVGVWADVNVALWKHTPPLAVFEALMADNDNWWWRLDSGHHLNLYEAAIEERDRFRAVLRAVLAECGPDALLFSANASWVEGYKDALHDVGLTITAALDAL